MVKLKSLQSKTRALELSKVRTLSVDDQTPRLTGRRRQERNARVLRHSPLCRSCEARGLVTPATVCDHVVPLWKGGADDESNLQPLCDACHDAKTSLEAAERARGDYQVVTPSTEAFDVGFA